VINQLLESLFLPLQNKKQRKILMKNSIFTTLLGKTKKYLDQNIFLKIKKTLKASNYVGMLKLSNYSKKNKSVFANTLKICKTIIWVYRVSKACYLAVNAFVYIYKMLM
ncbi:hypothetical protein, partial [Bacillus cereus]|uniref:hypothetical protein n=1 Tax=Bacillus cereus TaxID=1396 RepID=UPI000C02A3BC